jgi:hypothetical protein
MQGGIDRSAYIPQGLSDQIRVNAALGFRWMVMGFTTRVTGFRARMQIWRS